MLDDTENRLLEAIAHDVDDANAYLVYGDWLSQRGDLRGELIGTQHALLSAQGTDAARLRTREEQLLEQHRTEVFGVAAPQLNRSEIDWFCGFLRGASLEEGSKLLEHPAASFLVDVSATSLPRAHPHIRHLTTNQRELAPVLACPSLRSLRLAWEGELASARHGRLKRLQIDLRCHPNMLALPSVDFPALERLTLFWVYPDDGPALAQLLEERPGVVLDLGVDAEPSKPTNPRSFDAFASFAARVCTLSVNRLNGQGREALHALSFPHVHTLLVTSAPWRTEDRSRMWSLLPAMPALEAVLAYESERPDFGRGFAASPLREAVKFLSLSTSSPTAALDFLTAPLPKLTTLKLRFEAHPAVEKVGLETILANDPLPSVSALDVHPTSYLPQIARAPVGARLRHLTVHIDAIDDLRTVLDARKHLRSLETLVVRGKRVLSAAALSRLYDTGLIVEWGPHVVVRIPEDLFHIGSRPRTMPPISAMGGRT